MKNTLFPYLLLAFIVCTSSTISAQEDAIDQPFKTATIESLSQLMNDFYVFPEVAKKTEAHLKKQLAEGDYDEINDLEAFAKALTESVQSINHDKHMRIRPVRKGKAPENTPERMTEDLLNRIQQSRASAAGFNTVSILEGNVGYFDLRGFAGTDRGAPMADSYMKLIAGTDAVIVDLRKNGGGSPRMVQYLCSYFFDDHRHLNSLYWRQGDRTEDFWTLDEVNGEKMPDVPLFILTSSYTFSGAEEFSYNMQTQKRATLVGETTGGGANPGGSVQINNRLQVFIPGGKAINPITKTNWEGVGVVPEIKTSAEEAYDKAYNLAKEAAEKYRKEKYENHASILNDVHTELKKYGERKSNDDKVLEKFKVCKEVGLLTEGDINQMGYTYMLGFDEPQIAQAIFKTNTVLYSNSANVYDSYGEALLMNGEKQKAVDAYQKAVETAENNNDPNLELFKDNLKNAQNKKINKP